MKDPTPVGVWTRGIAIAGLMLALCPATASAATFTVTSPNDSTSACNGTVCPSLRSAIAAANNSPGSIVQLGSGTYTLGNGSGSPVGSGELQVYETMTIEGAGAGHTVIEQTDGQDRVLDSWSPDPQVTLRDLTITGGRLDSGASQPGAGIFTLSEMTLDHVSVSGNVEDGSTVLAPSDCCQAVGGIVSTSALTLTDSVVSNNHATADGGADSVANGGAGGQAVGGILAAKSRQLTLTGTTLSGNTATGGAGGRSGAGIGGAGGNAYGAMFVIDDAPLTMSSSTFSRNSAQAGTGGPGIFGGEGGSSYGGGLFSPDGTLEVSSSTFEDNVVAAGAGGPGSLGAGGAGGEARGGGLAGGSRTGANSIVNSTLYANEAEGGAGGSGSSTGVAGLSAGGGVAMDTALALTLVSSTLDANRADGAGPGYGGNLYDQWTALRLGQDIIADGVGDHGGNCAIAAVETDHGRNLESTSPSHCGFSHARGDLLAADPKLSAPADNGGPTQTMALAAGSPAVGAGGTCLDYSFSGDPRLTTDQRGKPRSAPCDIGAFQTQPGGGGGGGAHGGPLTIARFGQSASRWRAGSGMGRLAARLTVPTGTTFSFTLSAASGVELRFERLATGRIVRGRCAATTARNRRAPHCTRRSRAGFLVFAGAHAGANAIRFEGWLTRARRLHPGTFSVVLVAGAVKSAPLRFTIVRGR